MRIAGAPVMAGITSALPECTPCHAHVGAEPAGVDGCRCVLLGAGTSTWPRGGVPSAPSPDDARSAATPLPRPTWSGLDDGTNLASALPAGAVGDDADEDEGEPVDDQSARAARRLEVVGDVPAEVTEIVQPGDDGLE